MKPSCLLVQAIREDIAISRANRELVREWRRAGGLRGPYPLNCLNPWRRRRSRVLTTLRAQQLGHINSNQFADLSEQADWLVIALRTIEWQHGLGSSPHVQPVLSQEEYAAARVILGVLPDAQWGGHYGCFLTHGGPDTVIDRAQARQIAREKAKVLPHL